MPKKCIKLDIAERESDPEGIGQEIGIWPYEQVVNAQLKIHPKEGDVQTSLWF